MFFGNNKYFYFHSGCNQSELPVAYTVTRNFPISAARHPWDIIWVAASQVGVTPYDSGIII